MAQHTDKDETGLSFEAEPSGLPERTSYGARGVDPARDSSRANLTPGTPAQGHSIWATGAVKLAVSILIAGAIALALFWLT